MVTETHRVADLADARDLPLRTAAYVQALERLGEAMDATGTRALFENGR
jgi:glutamate dehydrogenase (NADP+)